MKHRAQSAPSAPESPVTDPVAIQKRILDTIVHKKNLVGSFPLATPLVPLYTLGAITRQTLGLVVCPDRITIQQHVESLRRMAIAYPQVAVLDGTQTPHLEREILEHVKHHRVNLVFTVPERFGSVQFLQMMVRLNVGFVAVEQSQFVLEGLSGSDHYQSLVKGWDALAQHPPLLLFCQPLSRDRQKEMAARMKMRHWDRMEAPPEPNLPLMSVRRLRTEAEKFSMLTRALKDSLPECQHLASRSAPPAEIGPDGPGSVIIHTQDVRTADKLTRMLLHQGWTHVYTYHAGLGWEECSTIERIFRHEAHCILVTAGHGAMHIRQPRHQGLKLIFWNACLSVPEMFNQVFRYTASDSPPVLGLLLYTRADYERALTLQVSSDWEQESMEETLLAPVRPTSLWQPLQEMRHWVLSEGCRYQSMIDDWQGAPTGRPVHCGQCDRCMAPSFGLIWESILKHWLY